jgi:hypothetical protein
MPSGRTWVLDHPAAACRNQSGDEHVGQDGDEHAEQGDEGEQDLLGSTPKRDHGLVEDVDDGKDDNGKDDDLPHWQALPVRLQDLDDLTERPCPDELDEPEDRRDALLQELD